jgi:hypothetical protein
MSDRTHLTAFQRMTVPSPDRQADDFYPTPPGATVALLRREAFPGNVWDPCCGFGGVSQPMLEWGWRVRSSDLQDRSYGPGGVDFLQERNDRVDHVVCNPPFKLAQPFAEHALAITTGKVAIFARLQWLESKPRRRLFDGGKLARVYVFTNRVPFQRGRRVEPGESGGRMMAFAWFVFDHSHCGAPMLSWIDYEEQPA